MTTPTDIEALEKLLENAVTDWDGTQEVDGAELVKPITCGDARRILATLRTIAGERETLEKDNAELERLNAWHKENSLQAHARADEAVLECSQMAEHLNDAIKETEAAEADRDLALALVDRVKMEARGHAMEARCANSTINEAYQAVTGATGEPGNWHGAEPIKTLVADRDRLSARVAELEKALTPSTETKAAYMGEFSVPLPEISEEGNEYIHHINVPWTTIKEIMAAIRDRAAQKDNPDG